MHSTYRAEVHFNDVRTPVVLPAGRFDLQSVEGEEDGAGLRRYSVITTGGEEIPVFLDPTRIAAVIPAPSNTIKGSNIRIPEPIVTTTSPAPGHDPGHELGRGAGHNPELTVLRFLCRFVAAKPRQLEKMLRVEARRAERLSSNKEETSWTRCTGLGREKLEEMRQKGLISIDDPFFYRRTNESVIVATDKGAALVGLEGLPPPPVKALAYGYRQYLEMVDLHLAILRGTDEEVLWITDRELASEKHRAVNEKELGRPLPAVEPPEHGMWPANPEALVYFKRRRLLAAIGLELTKVSNGRLKAYREILDGYSRNPEIDHLYLFFAHEEALEKVGELSGSHRRRGEKRFFILQSLPEDSRAQIVL